MMRWFACPEDDALQLRHTPRPACWEKADRTYPDNPYHPLDGRITEHGMHLTVDRALGYDVLIGITATPAV